MPRILLVENDPLQRNLYVKALSDYEVVAVANGHEALDMDWTAFDCCVIDLFMPGLAGDDLIRGMSEYYGDRLPPCILFTASPGYLTTKIQFPDSILLKGGGNVASVLQSLRDKIHESIGVRS